MINLTESAVDELRRVQQEEPSRNGRHLRLFVEKGGCAGWQYGMRFEEPAEQDEIIERDGVRVLIDKESAAMLKGSTIDFEDSLTSAGFKIINPNAARSCGCGTSFETQNAG